MSMGFAQLVGKIEEIASLDIQESWDNSGIQLVFDDRPVERVLVCLEITDQVIQEAEKKQVEMIITHHPLIFSPLHSIDYRIPIGSIIGKLASLKIAVYSCHTPFDKILGGNNDFIADKIGLVDVGGLILDGETEMIGRIGQLAEPLSLAETAELIREKLEVASVRTVGELEAKIKTIAICTGSGADLLDMVSSNGCQLFVTGDIKYHDAQNAKALGLCLIDAGHYGTEKFFGENFVMHLQNKVGNKIEIFNSEVMINPFI